MREAGYKVFMDVEDIRSGDFNVKLYEVISNCKDVLVVLSQNALDRCSEEDDWVRNELSFALKEGKNVIPIMLRGFTFPQTLPPDIEAIRRQNGLEASTEFFDAFIEKLYTFLKSKPAFKTRVKHNKELKKAVPFFIALVAIAVLFISGYLIYQSVLNRDFPYSKEEKNITGELLSNIGNSLANYNIMVAFEREALQAASSSIFSQDAVVTENALTSIDHAINSIMQIKTENTAISDTLDEKLLSTPIDKANVISLMDTYTSYQVQAADNLRLIKFIIRDSMFSADDKRKIVDVYLNINDANARIMVYLTNAVIQPIKEEALIEFKKTLSYCTALPYEGYVWLTDEEALDTQLSSSLNKLEAYLDELSAIVGSQNVNYANDVEEFRESLAALGYTDKQIDIYLTQVISKSADDLALKQHIQALTEELQAARESLDEGRAALRKKYAPLETDQFGILWSKMLLFLSVNMPEDALECLSVCTEIYGDSDSYAATYLKAMEDFINSIPETGIDYGAIVAGFEFDKKTHPSFNVGDILVAINGQRCFNADKITLSEGASLTLLRFTDGKPELVEVLYKKTDYRIAFYSLNYRDYAEAQEPYEGLDAAALWLKMCEFSAAVKVEQAIDCLQMYHMSVRSTDTNADIYVPALRFIYKEMKDLGINYGVIITEPGSESNLLAGDLIVAVNQVYCSDEKTLRELISNSGNELSIIRVTAASAESLTVNADSLSDVAVKNIG
jgi:hypothetical protein